jgi:hypothetical protein
MSEEPTIEQRLAALEAEVARLKERLERLAPENWVERISGSMKDYPEFEEVVRLGQEFRRSQQPPDAP